MTSYKGIVNQLNIKMSARNRISNNYSKTQNQPVETYIKYSTSGITIIELPGVL